MEITILVICFISGILYEKRMNKINKKNARNDQEIEIGHRERQLYHVGDKDKFTEDDIIRIVIDSIRTNKHGISRVIENA